MSHTRAVVIGGSVAGLLAAAAASTRFDEVVIVDRDELPDTPVPRKGVPQGDQIHVLIPLGLERISEIIPELKDELLRHGCREYDQLADTAYVSPAGWRRRVAGGAPNIGFRRPMLEWIIRKALHRRPNVSIKQASVRGLISSPDGSRIAGISLRDGSTVESDFVINASGRRSEASNWLKALGFETPVETTVNAYLGYSTQFVRFPSGAMPDGTLGIISLPIPGELRGGCILPADNGIYAFSAIGMMRDYPPRDRDGFIAFLDDARTPLLGQLARIAEPVSEIQSYHVSGNLRRHWENLESLPERFLVVGDAVASFNPIYGQGMTTAASAAVLLQRELESAADLDGVARRVQHGLSPLIDTAFGMAAGGDSTYPGSEATGNFTPPSQEDAELACAADAVAIHDPRVAFALGQTAFYIDPRSMETEEIREALTSWLEGDHEPAEPDFTTIPEDVDTQPLAGKV